MATTLRSQSVTKAFVRFRRMAPSRKRLIAVTLIAAVAASAFGVIVHGRIKHSLREVMRDQLASLVEVNAEALKVWIENEKLLVGSWARGPRVRSQTAELAAVAAAVNASPRDALLAAPATVELTETLQAAAEENEYLGFVLVGRSGVVLACDDSAAVGELVSVEALSVVAHAFNGQAFISRPFMDAAQAEGVGAPGDVMLMAVLAPVRDAGDRIIAALVFIIDSDQDFTRILRITQFGQTGQTYAFDATGLLLSDSRFDDQLKAIGLIPDRPDVTSALRVQVRDPGGNRTTGYRPKDLPIALPLTRMAASAVGGQAGVNIEGYRDFRGVTVVGAWQWLDEYGFGVVTEMGKTEGYA
ncbi:MAG: cache domain-containing protein, partial [Planctomycetota bacterium]